MQDLFFVELGVGGKSKDDFLAAFKFKGRKISTRAEEVLSQPAWTAGAEEKIRFGRCTIGDLGFTKNPQTPDIIARLHQLGHKECQPTDGPDLRLALGRHPVGKYFWVFMQELPDADDDPSMFYLDNDAQGKPCLNAGLIDAKRGWPLEHVLVFRL